MRARWITLALALIATVVARQPSIAAEPAQIRAANAQTLLDFARRKGGRGTQAYYAILRSNISLLQNTKRLADSDFNFPVDQQPIDASRQFQTRLDAFLSKSSSPRGGDPSDRVYHGEPVTGFPAVVGILKDYKTHCTGSYVGQNVILTAAHCICNKNTGDLIDASRFTVVFGSNVFEKSMRRFNSVEVTPFSSKFCPMKKSLKRFVHGDIAVIEIEDGDQHEINAYLEKEPTRWWQGGAATEKTQPVAIASPSLYFSTNVVSGDIVGFGRTETGDIGQKVRAASVPIRSKLCSAEAANANRCVPGREMTLIDPGSKRDTCGGDSGGPLFVQQSGEHYLAAITSRAATADFDCGHGGVYSLITPDVIDWLRGTFLLNIKVCSGPGDCTVWGRRR